MSEQLAVLVSPYFPPNTLAGVHRVRHLAKHLPAAGWRPVVLCVDEAFHEQPPDPELAALLPAGVEVVKVAALPVRMTRAVGVGDIGLRAWPSLRRGLMGLLAARPVKIVMITGSPYYPMLLAGAAKRRFKVPVVLDFQDPWVSHWGAEQPPLSKAGFSHRLATLLEPKALRHADFVTAVSDRQNAELAARYPRLDASRMAGIPIGGDPDDFAALRNGPISDRPSCLRRDVVNLSYVGTFPPRSGPLVRALFRGFARLRRTEPRLAARVRLNFIGTGGRPGVTSPPLVRPFAEAAGVDDAIVEVTERLSYVDALRVLANSTGLLLIGSDEPHYTASKIYPALMCGRPYLSLFHRGSSAHAVLAGAGGGLALAFDALDELAGLEAVLAEGLRALATRPESFGVPNPAAYASDTAHSVAMRFGQIFDRIAR
ncbi:MAG TPA: glycosyltransferase [Stellaceae bacterium]|nr:glycosyltransferase [Stellaceae bacterium]